jgi:colanic acid/amylovoran biosynthesis protein
MTSDAGPTRILIVNAHSQANAGDYAIVLGQLQLLNKIFPAARLTITSRTPELDRPLLASREVTVIPPIFHAPSGFSGGWRRWRNVILSLFFPRQALTFLRHLRRADLVMACGGGYFYSTRLVPGLTFWQNYLHIRMAVLFKKKIIFFPQSYGPLTSLLSRHLLGRLFASDPVRAVFAREAISLAFADGILPAGTAPSKLHLCPDMALYYSPGPAPFSPISDRLSALPRPRLALALRDWDFPQQKSRSARNRKREAYLQTMIATCQILHQTDNASFFIFSQAQGPSRVEDDRLISNHLYTRLCATIPPTHLLHIETPVGISPDSIIPWLQQADMLITSRMHAAIFAFLAGIPAVVIGYQHKSLGILRILGLEECSISIEETQRESLLPLCETVLQNRRDWVEKIRGTAAGVRESIEREFRNLFAESD